MYRIAICDKSHQNIENLQKYFDSVLNKMGIEGDIHVFEQTTQLLESECLEEFCIVLLEADMPQVNGIDAGQRIREVNQRAAIIYMCETKDYAYDAFKVQALGYLLKPIVKEELEQLLEYVHRIMAYFEMDKICIKSKDGLVSIFADEIIAVESEFRKAVYNLKDGRRITTVSNRSTFENSIMPIPQRAKFLQPHKSYFINMDYISVFRSDGITMTNGMQIPVSRDKVQESKKKYLNYAKMW